MSTPNPVDAYDGLCDLIVELRATTTHLVEDHLPAEDWLKVLEERSQRDWIGELEPHFRTLRQWAKQQLVDDRMKRAIEDIRGIVERLRWFIPARADTSDMVAILPSSHAEFDAVRAMGRGFLGQLDTVIRTKAEQPLVSESSPMNPSPNLTPAQRKILKFLADQSGDTNRKTIIKEMKIYQPQSVDNALKDLVDMFKFASKNGRGKYRATDAGRLILDNSKVQL